ncbi:hypothetical protein, partial [Neisseria gonorrhoeae]|uniref:hypothetical protein n=1 Tax=Neisseria gonorrhoeae TaxID=485 RepID=UPI001C990026
MFEHDLFGKPLRTFPDHALVQHQPCQQTHQLALPGNADLLEHPLEHVARRVFGDAQPVGGIPRRQSGADQGGDPGLAQRLSEDVADDGRI